MAETTTKIFEVDTGRAINSLKEYKQYIEDLKGTLLGLEKGTEEYNKTAQELRDAQQKLNEVMDIARGRAEGVEGSYDNLVAKMRELKKEWRATADETERSNLGQKILEINDQLKALDASTGNFQRNVGDYKNAFSDAFDKMLGPLGQMNTGISNLARDVKGMIPLIKTVNSTALSGLAGVKKAVASTGIGLLIVAVGELVANWESISKWVKETVGWTDKAAEAEARHKKELEEAANAAARITQELRKQAALNASLGMTEWENLKEQNKTLQGEIDKLGEKMAQKWETYVLYKDAALGDLKQMSADALEEYNSLLEQSKELSQQRDDNRQKIAEIANKAAYDAEQGLKTEAQILTEAYEKTKQLFEEQGKDTTALTAKYEKDLKALNEKTTGLSSSTKKINTELESLKNSALGIVKSLYESELDPFEKLENSIQQSKDLLEKADKAGVISHEDYLNAIEILDKQYAEGVNALMKDAADEMRKQQIADAKKAAEDAIDEVNDALKQKEIDLDFSKAFSKIELKPEKMGFFEGIGDAFNNIFGSQDTIVQAYSEKAKQLNDVFEMNKQASLDRIAIYEEELKKLPSDSEEYLSVQKMLSDEKINLNNLETQNFLDNLELEEEQEQKQAEARQARWQMFQMGLTATANLLNQFANAQQKQIQNDVKNGKITEQEARKKFKTVKAMQYASTVINTAQAAMGAYSAMASIPYVGPALGIAAAAAATAQGLMQLKQIKAQEFSDTSANTPSTPNMQPIVNEYTPQYINNVQTQSENTDFRNALGQISPVVTVTDIEDGLQANKVRVEENSF